MKINLNKRILYKLLYINTITNSSSNLCGCNLNEDDYWFSEIKDPVLFNNLQDIEHVINYYKKFHISSNLFIIEKV